MSQVNFSQDKLKKGVELFSDVMLMKFRPKSGDTTITKQSNIDQHPKYRTPGKIKYLELASKDSVIIGNSSQLDLINIDGLSHNFVDTFYYWSLSIGKSILEVKVNIKKEIMLVLTKRALMLYRYNTLKKEKSEPQFLTSIELQHEVRFIQFPTSDLIAIFYDHHFGIYSLNDSFQVTKKLEKQYGLADRFGLFAVPQAIDHTINIFFQETQQKKNTFGLWCMEVRLLSDNIKINPMYKIYDIMKGLKKILLLENYSNDIVFLNLGQQILVARKGYIVDSVNINLQIESSYLKYLPLKQILVHIEKNSVDLYSFKINLNSVPQRIQLVSLDSLEVPNRRGINRLISFLPLLDHNFGLFYEDTGTHLTTRGQVFYSFMVSYTVDLGQKVSRILEGNVADMNQDELQSKCDVLRKIGLSDQQIYLQIWRRSSRNTVKDFQYILATRDYKTIKGQIEAKLKKQSMSFKEVFKIQQSCLNILRPKIETEQCNEELLKDYVMCSLFLRKLSLYRDLHLLQNTPQQKLFSINIQEYYNLKNLELKEFVLQHIAAFLTGRGSILHLRLILNHFRFAYRFIYQDLLESIIKASKNQLRKVLEVLPELLPIDVQKIKTDQITQVSVCQGVWSAITEEQWESGQYLQKITNVYNREAVQEFVEGIWFKRNWLTSHDFIAKSSKEIESINPSSNPVEFFYIFIDKTFQSVKDPIILKSVLSHLEKTYDQLPDHLRNKILLYCTLYSYYRQNWEVARCPEFTFAQFLKLRDFNLFKYFFDFQKVKKNCLLREIKPIYQQVCGGKGFQIFNESLLSYFKSDESEISNLKYLLNRINNEKRQFHLAHEQMYEVLIRAMQFKLLIGSSNDIPIGQVLIYIENIPISRDNRTMIQQLEIIQKISEQSEIFKKMRINMTIREIIDNYETVIQKLVQYKITENRILIQDLATVISKTYRILAEVQSIKEKIYGADYNELAFFIYLTKLLEHEQKISLARDILNDEYLNNYYYIDTKIIESLVLYMYRWNFAQNPSFPKSKTYILKLSQLLPADNIIRQYMQNELQFALLLSTPKEPVTYPIATESSNPRVLDLEEILRFIDNKQIVLIDIYKVIQVMKRLEELSHNISELNRNSLINKSSLCSERVQQNSVYKTFINIFITRKLIREVIPIIRKSIEQEEKPEVITTFIMIYNLLPDLNQQSKNTLVKIASLLYTQPMKLLNIVERLLTTKLTGLESIAFLHRELQVLKPLNINFNEQNLIFNVYFIHINQQRQKRNKKILVRNTLVKLKKTKPQFAHEFIYDLIFTILCYEPYNIAIFLRYVKSPKWRYIRSFISYLIQEQIFDEINVLQTFRRVFYLLLRSFKEKMDIYRLTSQFSDKSLLEEFKVGNYERQQLTQFERKIQRNALAFEKKKNKIMTLQRSVTHSRQKKNPICDKEASIKESIQHPQQYRQKSANQYAFSDSDDNYEHEDEDEGTQQQVYNKRRLIQQVNFDPKSERKNFIRRDQKVNIESRKSSPKKDSRNVSKEHLNDVDGHNEFAQQLQKNNSKIKKYYSMDVRAGFDSELPIAAHDEIAPIQNPRTQEKRKTNSPQLSSKTAKKEESQLQRKTKKQQTFEQQVKKKQSKQVKRLEQFAKKLQSDEDSDIPILKIQTKASQKESLDRISNQGFESNVSSLLKKLYRTFDEKNENEPYNLKVMFTQKYKSSENQHIELFNKVSQRIYQQPDKNMQIVFKLLTQIAKAFPQLKLNAQNAGIFQKIAKLESKYGLELPIDKIVPYKALYLKNSTPEELFEYNKENIMQVCDDDNIFKLSKLISLGFKKNTIEQQIIYLYLKKLINELNTVKNNDELNRGLQKVKGVVTKMPVRSIVEKTESLVDLCAHIDLRPKMLGLLVDIIKIKGNGKDAKQLATKLK